MQNLASLNFTDAQLTAIDQTISQLEDQLAGLITLPAGSKKRSAKLGDKSESFCRQSLQTLAENPKILPPQIDVADAQRDMLTRDQLRPRLMRLECLLQRGNDTSFALGADAYNVAIQGYKLLKVIGRSAGLDPVRRELGNRFAKSRRASPAADKAA